MEAVVIVAATCTIILCIFGIIGNAINITLFFKYRSLQTVPNTLVTSASFIELFLVLLYPMQCLVDIKIINDNPGCMIFMSTISTLSMAYALIVLALSIERFITISMPLKYSSIITERRCYITIVMIAAYSVAVGLLPIITPLGNKSSLENDCRLHTVFTKGYVLWVFFNWIIPLPITIIMYIKVYIVVRRHARCITAAEITQTDAPNSKFKLKREAKTALLLFSMVVYFIIAWIPLIVVIMVTDPSEVVMLYIITHFFIYSTTAVNPFIYGVGNKLYRRHLLAMLGLKRLEPEVFPTISTRIANDS